MPTLDYYGFEHEDAITGIVAEYDIQPFNRCGRNSCGHGSRPLTAAWRRSVLCARNASDWDRRVFIYMWCTC